MKKAFTSMLAGVGCRIPYFPGKWRCIESLVQGAGLQGVWRDERAEVTRQGIRWQLRTDELVQRAVYFLGCYEVHETRWLRSVIQPEWVCCDIGSNFGYYSMVMSQATRGRATVHAFEPHPDLFAQLSRHAELNAFENVHPHQRALSDAAGRLNLVLPPSGNEGLGQVRETAAAVAEGERVVEVDAQPLDLFCEEEGLERLDFIKIDVEGAEARVLAGGWKSLERFRPRILMEINPPSLEECGTSAAEIMDRLRELDYVLHRLEGRKLVPLHGPEEIGDYVNAICLPGAS